MLLEESGFDRIKIVERGSDIGAIANKLTVLTIRLFSLNWKILWRLPLGLFVGLIATLFIISAHFTNAFGMGSKQDPLGYFVQAKLCY